MSKILYRAVSRLQSENESRTISGYAVVFDSWSRDLGGFYEIIRKGAISQELIDSSDVIMNVNHDDDKMVARAVNGEGTLHLTLKDDGLYFEFEAPPTALGDELLYHVRSGNLFECSFAFSLSGSDTCERWYKDEGTLRREILEIDGIFDCSIVTKAAYSSTSCSTRGLETEQINTNDILRDMDNKEKLVQLEEEIKKLRAELENQSEETVKEDETPVEEPTTETEEPAEEVEEKEEPETEEPVEEEVKEEETPADEEELEERNKSNKNKSNIRKMTKKFSLVKELRNAMETGKSINLGELNKRAYTTTDEGVDVVQTDVYDILEPLRAKNVLVAAGAKFMTGLVGNVNVPVMSANNVGWKGETAAADNGSGAFTHVALSPKRLTGKFPVSLELLAQDGVGVEDAIRRDIINAINGKLEATILGAEAGDANKPAGLFAGYEDKNTIAEFADVADLEAEIEAANVYGDCKYILSPSAKATLRSTIKGTAGVGMIMENGAVDGTEAFTTAHVPAGKMLYGDFSNLVIGQWGDVQLDVVRDTESLANGCVTIVVNAYFDAAVAREEAIVKANI